MVVGSLVAQTLYGLYLPIMVCPIDGVADGVDLAMTCDSKGAATLTFGDLRRGELS